MPNPRTYLATGIILKKTPFAEADLLITMFSREHGKLRGIVKGAQKSTSRMVGHFEPLTMEDVLNIVDKERPDGIIVQFGGQTPLNLAGGLVEAGAPIAGTSYEAIDCAEDRSRFAALLSGIGLVQPPNGSACLLYTSPSPRDGLLSRMPSSA